MQAVLKLLAWVLLLSLMGSSCRMRKPTNSNGTAPTDTTTNTNGTNPGSTGIPHFGALIGPPNQGTMEANDFKQKVARRLTIQYLRDNINLDTPKPHTLLESDFNVVLNINSTAPRIGKYYPFPTDTVAYKQKLSAILSSLPKMPVLVVIENEANNKGYYSGSAVDYINLLKAAIGVVHSYNIPVTDAGTTGIVVKYLLYQSYNQNGMRQQAAALKQRLNLKFGKWIEPSAAFADSVLTALSTLPVDYVNMHWYQNITDTQDLEAAVNYFKQRTGKEVISNEMGQTDTPDPNVVTAMIEKCKQLQMPYVLWYSGTGSTGDRPRALHTGKGTLDLNGQAFKSSILRDNR